MAKSSDTCPICGRDVNSLEAMVHLIDPYVNVPAGRQVCFDCFCVVKRWEERQDGEVIMFPVDDFTHLRTVEELGEDGYSKKEAEFMIKMVKKALKKKK